MPTQFSLSLLLLLQAVYVSLVVMTFAPRVCKHSSVPATGGYVLFALAPTVGIALVAREALVRELGAHALAPPSTLDVRPLLKREIHGLTLDAFNKAIKSHLPLDLAMNCHVGADRLAPSRRGKSAHHHVRPERAAATMAKLRADAELAAIATPRCPMPRLSSHRTSRACGRSLGC